MSTVLMVILGLVVVASFFLAYMSYQTWRVFQVILVVLVLLATFPFCYLAAAVLKTHQEWQLLVREQQGQIAQLKTENYELKEGAPKKDPALPGIRELKVQLHEIVRDRGQIWRGIVPEKVDEKTGAVELTVKEPDPSGILPKMVLFAFEDAPAGSEEHFLGEFKVGEVAGKSVKLDPNLPLDDAGLDQLKKSKVTWTLYATMPIESIDYAYLFWESHKQQVILDGAVAQMKDNLQRVETAVKQAQDEVKYRKAEKADLQADLARFVKEQTLVKDYLGVLQAQYKELRETLKSTYFANVKLAADIAKMQLQAAETIDRRAQEQASAEGPRATAKP